MKRTMFAVTLLLLAVSARAEYKDVIGFTITNDCSFAEYMKVVADFNKWAKPRGYQAQVFVPHNSDDLQTHYWVGTSADAASFGAAHDEWLKGVMEGDSEPAALAKRFGKCAKNESRQGFYAF